MNNNMNINMNINMNYHSNETSVSDIRYYSKKSPWIDIRKNGYPQLNEDEKEQEYPQRLVLAINPEDCPELLMWNFKEQCWDDETGDYFKYHKESIKYYMEIPKLPE